jgi:hypothetical protein
MVEAVSFGEFDERALGVILERVVKIEVSLHFFLLDVVHHLHR